MATQSTVTGPVQTPFGATPDRGYIRFQLTDWDAEGGTVITTTAVEEPIDVDTQDFSASLWASSEGDRGVNYKVTAVWYYSTVDKWVEDEIGYCEVGTSGPYALGDILVDDPIYPADIDYATAAATSAAEAAGYAADAALYDGPKYDSFAEMIADSATFSAGAQIQIPSIGAVYEATDGTGNLGQANAGGQEFDVLPAMGVVTPEIFGAVGDDAYDDAASFRNMWEFLRDQWFDNGVSYETKVLGKYYLQDPAQDLDDIAVFIVDFAGIIRGSKSGHIRVDGSSTAYIFQVGTWETRTLNRSISDIKVVSDTGTHSGWMLSDLFQMRSNISGLMADGVDFGITLNNCQEVTAQNLSVASSSTGLYLPPTSLIRADGSDGSYQSYSASSASNNNVISITVQAPTDTGVLHVRGQNNRISGVVQGPDATGYFVDLEGGDNLTLSDLWLECSTSTHRELRQQSGFGDVVMIGVKGVTTGSNAEFYGGLVTVLGSSQWVGSWDVDDGVVLVSDGYPISGITGDAIVLADHAPVPSNDATISSGMPSNRQSFYKGEIASGDSFRIAQFGNNSSDDETKGFWAEINLWEVGTSNMCSVSWCVDGVGTYPAIRESIEEKLGTLLGCSAALNAFKGGSTPYDILRADIENQGTNTLRYEIVVRRFIF